MSWVRKDESTFILHHGFNLCVRCHSLSMNKTWDKSKFQWPSFLQVVYIREAQSRKALLKSVAPTKILWQTDWWGQVLTSTLCEIAWGSSASLYASPEGWDLLADFLPCLTTPWQSGNTIYAWDEFVPPSSFYSNTEVFHSYHIALTKQYFHKLACLIQLLDNDKWNVSSTTHTCQANKSY